MKTSQQRRPRYGKEYSKMACLTFSQHPQNTNQKNYSKTVFSITFMDNISFKDNFYGKSNLKRHYDKLVQVFNNRSSKIIERQPFKNLKFSIF